MSEELSPIEKLILNNLPSSSGHLQHCLSDCFRWREVDRGIQKLRRRGLIQFKRKGRTPIWERMPAVVNIPHEGTIK